KKFKPSTEILQLGRDPNKQNGYVNGPIYRASTIKYNSVSDIENRNARYDYGKAGSQTIENLESAWTHLTGAAGTVLSPYGL
ncbi:PLP-dependent transferase, partial [Salmonella enterica]|uniref:PLP-dependent transferase n=1 Tax=Salmonella enterica TaxID=28901 RepID=UPI0026663ADD